MKIAITGGSGFVGRHLAQSLLENGHEVVLVARGIDRRSPMPTSARFASSDLSRVEDLLAAFEGCDVVAHCAGINREIGAQTYEQVHVTGTRNVVEAAKMAGVRKIILMSFLRARPNCGSAYHETKWRAEEIVRASGLDYTVLKCGMIYGRGDHMLDHLSHSLHTFPLLPTVGLNPKPIRPLAIDDLVRVMLAAALDGRLTRATVAVTGAEQLLLKDAAKRVARVIGKPIITFPMPVWFHYVLAWLFEQTMNIPLAARAQVRILSEGVVEPAPFSDELPKDLAPQLRFTDEQIEKGLPAAAPFSVRDLRCCAHS